jgi:hypothetical protein
MPDSPSELLAKALKIREEAATPAQAQRREEVRRRNQAISEGVRAKDGVTFGKKGQS